MKEKHVYLLSGPCGAGKSTMAETLADYLTCEGGRDQVYVIHGDDFHRNLRATSRWVGPDREGFMYWKDTLPFIWQCMLDTADKVLACGPDVIMDYVVEGELPLVMALCRKYGAKLHYIVLTAEENELKKRLEKRGDPHLMERSMELKGILGTMDVNQGHLLDTTGREMRALIRETESGRFDVRCD